MLIEVSSGERTNVHRTKVKSKIRPCQLLLKHGWKPCQRRDTFLDLFSNIPTFQAAGFISFDCIKRFLIVVQ